jgi:hypothetical protein
MNQEQSELSVRPPNPKWIADWWSKIATFLAILSLVDVTHQVVEWATIIHAIMSIYVTTREWLFGWLPFRIPPAWHNYIILACMAFSVGNIGYYKTTGRIFAFAVAKTLTGHGDDFSTLAGHRGDDLSSKGALKFVLTVSVWLVIGAFFVVAFCYIAGIAIMIYEPFRNIWALTLIPVWLLLISGAMFSILVAYYYGSWSACQH